MNFGNISTNEEESKKNEFDSLFHQADSSYLKIFCLDCIQIPEYKKEIDKNKNISLSHICNNVEKNIPFPWEEEIRRPPDNKCIYCRKKCNLLCIECNQYVCNECWKSHILEENFEEPENWIIKGEDKIRSKQHICPFDDVQFICKTHFIQYEFFCPICKINLCHNCKNYHIHIGCNLLYDYKVNMQNQSIIHSESDYFIKNINQISQIFEECYLNSLKNKKISINIILNYSTIKEINIFLNDYSKQKIHSNKIIISNTIFKNEKIDNYLCKYFYDRKFKKNYSDLIYLVYNGDYESHHKMEVLKNSILK